MRGLIYGVSGPIGRATYLRYDDDNVLVFDRKIPADLEIKHGDEIVECDILHAGHFETLCAELSSEWGEFDFAVYNVALTTEGMLDRGREFDDDEIFSEFLSVNLRGSYRFLKALMPKLKSGGSIVLTSSIYAVIGVWPDLYEGTNLKTFPGYAASKAGIDGLVRYYCAECGARNVRLNSVVPGGVFNNQQQSFVDAYSQRVPMKRMAHGNEVADLIYFLTSSRSTYIHGQSIIIDGGLSSV